MIDHEKVIKGLEHCRQYGTLCGSDCRGYYEYTNDFKNIIKVNDHRIDCPYGKTTGCVVTLVDDALAILKGQRQKAIRPGFDPSKKIWNCGNCGTPFGRCLYSFCPKCGSKVG